jgi:hypothetical protein
MNPRLLLASLFLIPVLPLHLSGQQAPPASSGDLDIYETVIRFQIKSWDLPAHTYCIKVNQRDADEALLKRFPSLPVKSASACGETDVKTLSHVVDKETKKKAVVFDVGTIHRLSDSELKSRAGTIAAVCAWPVASTGSRGVVMARYGPAMAPDGVAPCPSSAHSCSSPQTEAL